MASEHSPGPWRVLSDGTVWTDEPCYRLPGGNRYLAPHGNSICKLTERQTSLGSYFEKGDARLIAAAPEMLAALEEWVRQVDDAAQGDASVARAILARVRA